MKNKRWATSMSLNSKDYELFKKCMEFDGSLSIIRIFRIGMETIEQEINKFLDKEKIL